MTRQVEFMVIGGGLAGATCAEALRAEGATGTILLIGEEPGLPYQRPPLSKTFITSAQESTARPVVSEARFKELDIDVALGRPVASVDARKRLVRLPLWVGLLHPAVVPEQSGNVFGNITRHDLIALRGPVHIVQPIDRVSEVFAVLNNFPGTDIHGSPGAKAIRRTGQVKHTVHHVMRMHAAIIVRWGKLAPQRIAGIVDPQDKWLIISGIDFRAGEDITIRHGDYSAGRIFTESRLADGFLPKQITVVIQLYQPGIGAVQVEIFERSPDDKPAIVGGRDVTEPVVGKLTVGFFPNYRAVFIQFDQQGIGVVVRWVKRFPGNQITVGGFEHVVNDIVARPAVSLLERGGLTKEVGTKQANKPE